ncbi:MAG: alpha-glucuronidase [Lachnospiraceae bacterium]|nr:alpha-glucuronidase [Lachnospiraceae bacterium]
MDEDKRWTQLWLAYNPCQDAGNGGLFQHTTLCGFDREHPVLRNALAELERGLNKMLGITHVIEWSTPSHDGKSADQALLPDTGFTVRRVSEGIRPEGYRLTEQDGILTLEAADEKGVLYGIFHILRQIALEQPLMQTNVLCEPDNPLRMLNHWDNMDGSIERGYSGNSFFFENGEVLVDERTHDYARLAASVGINGAVLNNVNVKDQATWLITDRYFDKVAQIARIFEGYGIKLFLSLNYASPLELGNLNSADPLNEDVIAWWRGKFSEVFARIPNLGGFLVKADSEGRPGPFTYGRTQADGANMLADLVKPHGGIIIWRCFVYNCTQDWRDTKTDRARAGYDNFIEMDGDYHDNVILQIKNGPMDFQIREPVSPLLGGLTRTNQMLEVQAAQEYTGQQIDLCYLIPLFKEVLDFKTYCRPDIDTVADVVSGRTFGNSLCGMAAVSNTGNDENWTGNDLAAANFYGFGRLAFSTSLSAEEIAAEWAGMTYSNDREVKDSIVKLLMGSRDTYEKYTSPLGIGWMVTPNTHYGPSVDGYEYSRWGTYHRADHLGLGVDRTDSGTGYVRQYHEPNASRYNSVEECPEELLLFFHHLPYTHMLKSGKTLIQHIYDSHFEGVEEVEEMIRVWESLKGRIPDASYELVRERFDRQLYNAKEWRDQVNSYFYRKSNIPDEKKRVVF